MTNYLLTLATTVSIWIMYVICVNFNLLNNSMHIYLLKIKV